MSRHTSILHLIIALMLLVSPTHAITHHIKGRIQCRVTEDPGTKLVNPPHLRVRIENGAGLEGLTDGFGQFASDVTMMTNEATVRLIYSDEIEATNAPNVATPLEVMDDVHQTRSDSKTVTGTVQGDTLELGTVEFDSLDCELWRIGVKLLDDYYALMKAAPPAKALRFKRWGAVIVGTAHTYYDYIPVPTDFMTDTERDSEWSRECTLFHEFGHDIYFPLDGDKTHWDGDLMAYAYGRSHDGDEITNAHYAWSEGWANYWRINRKHCGPGVTPPAAQFLDWNEWLIGSELNRLSSLAPNGAQSMVEVLSDPNNRGKIHSLREFVIAFHDRFPIAAPLPPVPAECPPGFVDDGKTCRRDSEAKPSYTRGAGAVPSHCDANSERSGALCYPKCSPGFVGNGPVCWKPCPAGYSDDGAFCRRNATIIGADNSQCPIIDKCGLTFNKGCSKCPPGYANDGCTCRIDAHIFAQQSTTRGAGSAMQCAAGEQSDAGLCYTRCKPGFRGAGPVCWGQCPADTRDDGANCFRPSLVLIK